MKKLFLISITCLFAASTFNSCKQCNTPKDNVVKHDSTSAPGMDIINEEIRKDSLNPFLYFKRAQINEANNDIRSALTDMFLALTLDSLRPEFYLYTAELFKKDEGPDKRLALQRGISFMNKAIATDSFNTSFYVKAAELAYTDTTLKNNNAIALTYLNTAIDKNPQDAAIYFFKGTIFRDLGDTAKAISSFQTATELDPKFYNAYIQLALILRNKNDRNAEKYLDNAIKVNDKPENALFVKANFLKEDGFALADLNKFDASDKKISEAIAAFKKVIELNYKNVEAYMAIGKCYYQLDSLEDAYHYYELATKIQPTYAGAYFSKGLCAEELGRTKEAMSLYQTCLNIDPGFTRAEDHLKKLKETQ